jgi:glycosyltransferase involved in cell wall biosynthesis
MHAVFVLARFFPYRGGYENTVLALAKSLVRRGHRVTVYTTVASDLESLWLPGYKTFPAEQITVDGVLVHRLPVCYKKLRRKATRLLGILPYWRWKAQYWRPGFRVLGLEKALRQAKADLIHIGPLPYNTMMYAGLHAAEAEGVPVIATPCTHLGEDNNNQVSQFYVQPHLISMLKRCDRVLCMTEFELEQLQAAGVPANKMAVMSSGIDVESVTGGSADRFRQHYKVEGPVVLHLGMKAFEKGSHTLVEAMKILWARGSQAWLVMAGPALARFDEYIANQTNGFPRLVNLPAFEDTEKRDFLAAATVVAQPSRVESLGLVILEAWANAKPTIAADIAVSRELVVAAGGGVVVPFGNSVRLADAIEDLLAKPALRRQMGLRGQKKVLAEYQSGYVFQRNAEEFERVLAYHSRSSAHL